MRAVRIVPGPEAGRLEIQEIARPEPGPGQALVRVIGVTFRTRTEEERLACVEACARDVLPLLSTGRVKSPIDRVFAMDDIAPAHAYMQTNRHFGKILIAVDPEILAAAEREP